MVALLHWRKYSMPRPTQAMAQAARKGLKMRRTSPPSRQGGTRVGVARANQFARRENVSLETVRRTYSFLSRAKTYYKPGQDTPGTQAYLLWGGPAGLRWAKRILGK
jgi:hypothetical protein